MGDIWLTPHTEPFAFDAKRARVAAEGVAAWVDPEGYRRWVGVQRQKFETALAKERVPKAKSAAQGAVADR